MNISSKKTTLVLLAITALLLSRIPFFFFNDPEGPNLLVVGVAALIVYAITLGAYFLTPLKRLWQLILIQIIIVTAFYFGLR